MCGRFALGMPRERLEEAVNGPVPGEFEPSWNMAPGRNIPAVTPEECAMLRWGLVPHWIKDKASGRRLGMRLMNARCETVFDKPAFRGPARSGRCLIPAEAFYEWKCSGRTKQPYAIASSSGRTLFFAAVRDRWTDPGTGEVLSSCCILTTRANSLMAPIHERMPVIVRQGYRDLWLDHGVADPDWFSSVFDPVPPKYLRAWPVGFGINKVGHDGPELLARQSEPPRQGSLLGDAVLRS